MNGPSATAGTRVSLDLARWAASARWRGLPEPIRDRARLMWGDTLGSLMLGADHEETVALANVVRAERPEGRTACAVGGVERLTPLDAILVNATATGVHFFDGGNVSSRGHVSGYIQAATLTAAERTGATFEAALAAYVVGYEVAARIGASCSLPPAMHPAATWSVIGAAAAVARLHELTAESFADVLELAANLTLATSWDAAVQGATVRDLYHAMPNYLGTLVFDLFRAGFRGGPRSIEVTFGSVSAPAFDAARAVRGLGGEFLLDDDYLKRYPCCRNFHATLDALFEALPALPRPFDSVRDRVRIGTDAIAFRDNREVHAENVLGVRESLPMNAAKALRSGALTPEMYAADVFAPPEAVRLAARIEVTEAPRPTPDARPGWIEIIQDEAITRREVTHPAGNPAAQLSAGEIEAKFRTNAQRLLGNDAPAIAGEIFHGDLSTKLDRALPRWLGHTVLAQR